MARNKVPVYSVHGNILRHVTIAQAEEMIGNSAKRVSRIKAPLKIQLTHLERVDRNSPASISYSEVLANAGVPHDGQGNTLSRQYQVQVQAKVAGFRIPSWADRVVSA